MKFPKLLFRRETPDEMTQRIDAYFAPQVELEMWKMEWEFKLFGRYGYNNSFWASERGKELLRHYEPDQV